MVYEIIEFYVIGVFKAFCDGRNNGKSHTHTHLYILMECLELIMFIKYILFFILDSLNKNLG